MTGGGGEEADLDEFFRVLQIGLDQLYATADALRHIAQSLAEECTTGQECVGDLNEAVSLIFTGCMSILDAVNLRLMQEVTR